MPANETNYFQQKRGTANRGLPFRPINAIKLSPLFDENFFQELLVTRIKKLLKVKFHNNSGVASKVFNERIKDKSIPITGRSHLIREEDINARLLYFIDYAKCLYFGEGTDDNLIIETLKLENQYEEENSGNNVEAKIKYKKEVYRNLLATGLVENYTKKKAKVEISDLDRKKLNETFENYITSGSNKDGKACLTQYLYVINGDYQTLKESLSFLDKESSTYLGRFITWTGDIYRPKFDILGKGVDAKYDYLNESAKKYHVAQDISPFFKSLGEIDEFYQYVLSILNKFEIDSKTEAHRIASILKWSSFIITTIASGPLGIIRTAITASITSFGTHILNNIIKGDDLNIIDGLKHAAIEGGVTAIAAVATQKLMIRFNKFKISPILKEPIEIAINKISNDISGELVSCLQNKRTIGEALSDFSEKLRDPDSWVEAIVSHNYNKLIAPYVNPIITNIPEKTRIYPVKSTKNKFKPILPKKLVDNKFLLSFVTAGVLFLKPETVSPTPNKPTPSLVEGRGVNSGKENNLTNPLPSQKATNEISKSRSDKAVSLTVGKDNNGNKLGIEDRKISKFDEGITENQNSRETSNRLGAAPPPKPKPPKPWPAIAPVTPFNRKKDSDKFEDFLKFIHDKFKKINKKTVGRSEKISKKIVERLKQIKDEDTIDAIISRVKEILNTESLNKFQDLLQAQLNKANETYAVEKTTEHIQNNEHVFGKIISKEIIDRRGENGPEILDLVLNMSNGKTLIVEVKYNRSQPNQSKYGQKTITQFEPEWFELRLVELNKTNPKIAKSLLEQWKDGKIDAYLISINVEGNTKMWEDWTPEWDNYIKKNYSNIKNKL